jgi:hypothetical protein
MKNQVHSNVLETNFLGSTKKFGIGNVPKIISILRDKLYENKIQCLTQEYICNARDSMREAGKGNEFEITVPTHLNPVFKVKDFGTGISPDKMDEIFTMYGSSTKEHSNAFTGNFGIGSKSAWAYTDSFSVISVVNGFKRSYVAHTGTDSSGSLDLVSVEKTNEGNGVEIQVAVKSHDIEEFRLAVFRAIYFWEQKPKLRGELDTPTLIQGHEVGQTVEVISHKLLPEYVRGDYNDIGIAVIDGIPYPLTEKLVNKCPKLCQLKNLLKEELILHFGNGIVEVSASRESIADSKVTVSSLDRIASKALIEVQTYISKAFGKVVTTSEYFETYNMLSGSFVVDKFAKFGDYTIEGDWWVKNPLFKSVKMTSISTLNRRGHRVQKVTKTEFHQGKRDISIKQINDLFFFSTLESKVKQNKRVREYLKNGSQMTIIEPLLVHKYKTVKLSDGTTKQEIESSKLDTASYDKVLADLSVKDFSTIEYVEELKQPKVKLLRDDKQICLHVFDRHNRHDYVTLKDNTTKWLYFPIKNGYQKYENEVLKELNQFLKESEGMSICGVAERAESMVEGNKNFSLLDNWLDSYTSNKETRAYVKGILSQNNSTIETISRVKDIEDTFLTEMIEEYKSVTKSKIKVVPEILVNKIKKEQEIKDFEERDKKLTLSVDKDYPLLKDCKYIVHHNELGFYINAKFNDKKGKK